MKKKGGEGENKGKEIKKKKQQGPQRPAAHRRLHRGRRKETERGHNGEKGRRLGTKVTSALPKKEKKEKRRGRTAGGPLLKL